MFSNKSNCARLSIFSLGFACGITKGLYMILLTWASTSGMAMSQMAQYQHAYGLTAIIMGIIYGFIFGAVIAFFYNLCLCCPFCKKK